MGRIFAAGGPLYDSSKAVMNFLSHCPLALYIQTTPKINHSQLSLPNKQFLTKFDFLLSGGGGGGGKEGECGALTTYSSKLTPQNFSVLAWRGAPATL